MVKHLRRTQDVAETIKLLKDSSLLLPLAQAPSHPPAPSGSRESFQSQGVRYSPINMESPSANTSRITSDSSMSPNEGPYQQSSSDRYSSADQSMTDGTAVRHGPIERAPQEQPATNYARTDHQQPPPPSEYAAPRYARANDQPMPDAPPGSRAEESRHAG